MEELPQETGRITTINATVIALLAPQAWTSLLSGLLRGKRGAQHGGYENLWFSRLNLVETFSKHSLHVNNIVFDA